MGEVKTMERINNDDMEGVDFEDEVCPECGGTGEVPTMEPVYYGEPHMASIGMRKCICRIFEEDFDDE